MHILIVGNSGGTNIGDSLAQSASTLSIKVTYFDTRLAYKAPKFIRQLNWHLRGKHPSKLHQFNQDIIHFCRSNYPTLLLSLGLAPITDQTLKLLHHLGIWRVNFLTDDPWNASHYAPWFFRALPHYDVVFSPRRINLEDLKQIGCGRVEYLPFGYDPQLFYPEAETSLPDDTQQDGGVDVVFAGAGDRDRVPYLNALIKAGLGVSLYGSYWERYPETRPYTHGQADLPTLRKAISSAKVALCLVRRANRDGHCMRTFEVPAIGACMLTEDTPEHREIFGPEGEAVLYFSTLNEMIEKTHWLLSHTIERQQLAKKAHQLITQGGHTYRDRLQTMLSIAST